MLDVVGNKIGQVTVLGCRPGILDWVKFWGVRRKVFALNPLTPTLRYFSLGRTVHIPTVPDQDKGASSVTEQIAHESHRILADDIVFVNVETQVQPVAAW